MKHSEIEKWVDFIHGFGPEEDHRSMEAHLSTCERCGGTVKFLENLKVTAVAEGRYDVPRDVEFQAKSLFSSMRPERVGLLPRLTAMLVFSTDLAPQVAGVRAVAQQFSQQALYEAGDFSLDLRIDQEIGAPRLLLVGQVLDRVQPSRKLVSVPVLLMSGEEVVARATSNQFGEFSMEYEPSKRLRLWVAVDAGRKIEVALGAFSARTNNPRASSTSAKRKKADRHAR